jgi:hypothetical protein
MKEEKTLTAELGESQLHLLSFETGTVIKDSSSCCMVYLHKNNCNMS